MSDIDLLPPHDMSAEMALLASDIQCLGDIECRAAMTLLPPLAFMDGNLRIVFEQVRQLCAVGRDVDAVSLKSAMVKNGTLEGIGGIEFLFKIIDALPTWVHWRTYMAAVKDAYSRREALRFSIWVKEQVYDKDFSADEMSSRIMLAAGRLVANSNELEYSSIAAAAHTEFDQMEAKQEPGITCGIQAIDQSIGYMQPGEMVVVAARPSVGKSTLLRSMALGAGHRTVPVGIISLEESIRKVSRNLISAEGSIDNHAIRRRQMTTEQWVSAGEAVGRLANLPIYIADKARTIAQIRAMTSLLKARHGCKLIIVDYLGRIGGARGHSAYERVSEISLAMSDIAKAANVSLVIAVQLNRAVAGRDDKRPTMSDLRDSGQIEQDADTILLLHREDYWRQNEPGYVMNGTTELIVAKARDGVRGQTIKLRSELRYQRFDEYQEEYAI